MFILFIFSLILISSVTLISWLLNGPLYITVSGLVLLCTVFATITVMSAYWLATYTSAGVGNGGGGGLIFLLVGGGISLILGAILSFILTYKFGIKWHLMCWIIGPLLFVIGEKIQHRATYGVETDTNVTFDQEDLVEATTVKLITNLEALAKLEEWVLEFDLKENPRLVSLNSRLMAASEWVKVNNTKASLDKLEPDNVSAGFRISLIKRTTEDFNHIMKNISDHSEQILLRSKEIKAEHYWKIEFVSYLQGGYVILINAESGVPEVIQSIPEG